MSNPTPPLFAAAAAAFGAAALGAALAAMAATGCAEAPPPLPTSLGATPAARTAPDDGDAWNLVPATATSLADVDLVALRASPWSRALVTGGFAEDRDERLRQLGYDVFNDADRVVVAALDVAGAPKQIVVVAGRFDAEKIARAFLSSTPGAAATRWRDCRIWEGGGRSLALVGRTLVQGAPDTVRAAVDAAWGIVPDARDGPLGTLARGEDAVARPAAITLAVIVTDDVRARADGIVELPPGLSRLAARLDLGADLELDAQAILGDGAQATAAARAWSGAVRDLRQQRMLRVMGLGPVVDGVTLQAEGARVHGRLHVAADQREALSERLLFLLQTIAQAHGAPPAGTPSPSSSPPRP
jgi:hypothetical protein